MSIMLLMGGSPDGGGAMNFIFLGLLFVVMYFFMIRPQAKRAKDQRNFINNLQKGDKIVTLGGVHGKIKQVDEQSIVIEVEDGGTLRIEKTAVSHDLSKPAAPAKK